MTVSGLIYKFVQRIARIEISCETDNITYTFKNDKDAIAKYGSAIVSDWQYVRVSNLLWIYIEKE